MLNSILLILTILIILPLIQTAEADTNTITGSDGKIDVFISNENDLNIIIFQTENGLSKHYDSKLKTYNSGGFSMKNYETGILVFGHKITNDKYKLVIITSEKIYRLIGFVDTLEEIKPEITEKIEPKNSIGSDITKYDIPTQNPRDTQNTPILKITGFEFDTRYLNDKFDTMYRVHEVKQNKNIVGAEVTLEISRDGFVHKKLSKVTENGGLVRFEIDDMIYPLFYPNLCYNLDIVATYGNLTAVWDDNFIMGYPKNVRVWEPNFDWVIDAKWNYLPHSFKDEPRQSIYADAHCN